MDKEKQREVAKLLFDLDLVPIPIRGKVPYRPKWQHTSKEEALRKFEKPREGDNIGIITGEKSNIIVVDIDERNINDWNNLIEKHGEPDTLVVKTGTGFHYYFILTERDKILRNGVKKPFDLRTTGGQVVGPFSVHENGNIYTPIKGWIETDNGVEIKLDEMPEWLFNLFYTQQK